MIQNDHDFADDFSRYIFLIENLFDLIVISSIRNCPAPIRRQVIFYAKNAINFEQMSTL